MANKYNSIVEINAEKESWRIIVKVLRLWMVYDVSTHKQTSNNKIPLSMEMVLVDSKTLIYKFEKSLQKGKVYSIQFFGVAENGGMYRTTHHKYKIVFQYSTKVVLVDNASVPDSVYDFVPIKAIVCGGYDNDYLVEFFKHRLSIECTLFGPFVDELNAFLESGEVENVVVIVHVAKIKLHLQNCICGTRVVFNAKCEEVKELATRMSEDFLYNTPRKTISALKDCFEDTCFVVFGTMKHVVDDEEWWYTACTCNKCRIKVGVIDKTDSATFVIFDWDATILFSKSCANMFETYQKRGLVGTFPRDITNLVDRFFLFKVEVKSVCNSQFEKTFRVKKIYTNLSIIKLLKEGLVDDTSLTQTQDSKELTPTKHNFCCKSAVGELTPNESEFAIRNQENDILFNNSGDLTPVGIVFGTQIHSLTKNMEGADKQLESGCLENVKTKENSRSQSLEMHLPLNFLKKRIKVEKI
ncbi:hypothetical protein JHK82_012291 [Glycine max]|nr:hypothetical protein JHK85_012643 [Glycine max]KAG5057305.1 hypothetical protein JHK86_012301 [Glycine max]KAG5154322.1 hypothetical protein JHK82_012291 [Glycine max]